MRVLALALAVALVGVVAGPARSDPRSPFSDDAIRTSAGIATFTEVPPPASRVHTEFHYDAVPVAGGITSFIEGPSHAMVQGNITLIVGSQAALVIDSGHYPAVALRVIADMRKLTSKAVRYLAITHWHMDHYMANSQFAEAYPGLTIIAQNFTAPMMDKYGARYVNYGAKVDDNLKPLREMLTSGKAPDGADIAPDRRARIETVIREVEAAKPEFGLMRYRGADLTFENEIDVDLGGRIVKLMHLGRGNTAGDLFAYVPDAKLLITGDILVHPIPFSYGSYLTEWPVVLKELADFDATTIVPGHGPVMHDKAYLKDVRELLEAVFAEVKRVWKPGMSADDVRKAIDLSAQRDKFCHGDQTLEKNFNASIETAGVDRAVQELEGKMKPESFDEPDA
jgi:glyoxylase-like metal-dependent hydrolase (beta-lactamase superfamily II)